MSRRTNLNITAVAGAGLIWPALLLSPTATADPTPSPGVPCLDMVQQFAAAPPSVPESLESASSVLTALPQQAASVPPIPAVPVADVVEGVSAPPAPNPAPLLPEAAGAPVPPAGGGGPSAPPAVGPAAPLPGAEAAPLPPAVDPSVEPVGVGRRVSSVPGLPVQLPSAISMPNDLVCEGTAW